ncbi:hypothetical protein V2J09_001528 [Rumex salicifolius]
MIRLHDPRAIALVKTHISGSRTDDVCRQIGFEGFRRMEASGFSSGIWLIWRTTEVIVTPICLHPQNVTVETKRRGEDPWVFSEIYGSPTTATRLELWRELEEFVTSNCLPCLLAGDFNTTSSSSERSSYSRSTQRGSEIFNDWIDKLDLVDIGYSGPKTTTCLDHALCNGNWSLRFPDACVQHLSTAYSDHLPILIRLAGISSSSGNNRPFRFQAAWLQHEGFKDLIESSWSKSLSTQTRWHATSSSYLPIKRLNKLEKKLWRELATILEQEQLLWWQKSRANFLVDGDGTPDSITCRRSSGGKPTRSLLSRAPMVSGLRTRTFSTKMLSHTFPPSTSP